MTEPTPTVPAEPTAAAAVTEPTPPAAVAPAAEPAPDVRPEDDDAELVVVVELDVTVLITPAEGQPLEGLARTLLDLAEHPHHVEWRPRQGAFEVPAALAQAYAQAVTPVAETKKSATRKGSRTTKGKKEGGTGG